MSKPQGNKKKRAGTLRSDKPLKDFDRYLALPDDEIRRLALLITTRDGVEPFVRRMVLLLDSLYTRQTRQVARLARHTRDRHFAELMSAVSHQVKQGRLWSARTTAFLAASYAYQNSLDYLCGFLDYLNRLRQNRD